MPPQQNELHVINGKDLAESKHRGVVQIGMGVKGQSLDALCTGTWVSSDTILTAAHCMWDWTVDGVWKDVWVIQGEAKGAKSSKIYIHPDYTWDFGEGGFVYDIAVVKFPKNTAKKFIGVAKKTPKKNDSLEIVGYGIVAEGNFSSSGKRRSGTNKVHNVNKRIAIQGHYYQVGSDESGSSVSTGKDVLNGSGDSGGPMLVGGLVVGVSSTASVENATPDKKEGYYVNIFHPDQKKFLLSAIKSHGVSITNLK